MTRPPSYLATTPHFRIGKVCLPFERDPGPSMQSNLDNIAGGDVHTEIA
ncbi:hypothetical protein [Altererythrobacter sp.]